MVYFVFQNRIYDQSRNPLMLQGASLDERFDPKALEQDDVGYDWHTNTYSVHYPIEETLAFPDELWLNTGERRLDFDFRIDMHGLILSQKFLDIFYGKISHNYKIVKLNVVNRKGKTITSTQMYYAKCRRPQFVVDEMNSKTFFETRQVGILPMEVKCFERVVFKDGLEGSFIEPIDLESCIVLNFDPTDEFKDMKLEGFNFVAEENFVAAYNDRHTIRNMDGTIVSPF